jgi:hypothetical protein
MKKKSYQEINFAPGKGKSAINKKGCLLSGANAA